MTVTPDWTSVHIHYHDSLDELITGAVRPLAADLTGRGHLDGYFFVRHWQGGPHLRLRLRTPADVTGPVEQHIGGFLAASPSRTVISEEDYLRVAGPLVSIERGQDEVEPLRPNNSVHHVAYQPEYARYGGTPEAMRAVERNFTESSALVAEVLAASADPGRRTGQALAMMLVCALTAAGSADALPGYLATGQRDWGRRLLFGDADAGERRFEEKYQRQRPRLIALVEEITRLAGEPEAGPPSAVTRWLSSVRTLRAELAALRERGLFTPAEVLMSRVDGADAELGSVLLFCSHMHNNRLGISLPEEAYLMYLLLRATTEAAGVPG
ncbi:thiopeptide-type bacteriocin biosynthesis protein [Amycolatopsis suaedae]|uniref:Thiopeptide-type bacteriocin biosynthesis domain-containing protein n=1 Tax=Amycolatopsis suaedae TaxID=2510978 RepID=A0A4Q7JCA4_9PSEU|nr:thiopeptide-type bacteriocin biosynthesis protein [Amycolatopsis suaedae]RZQ63934.1 hypothetical protein EWH70_12375 [Amycolatopsis suaedae]